MAARVAPTPRGFAALALGAVAIIVGAALGLTVVVAFGVFCGAALVVALAVALLPDERAEVDARVEPALVTVGDTVTVSLRLRRAARSIRVVRERRDEALEALAGPAATDDATLRYTFTAERRGAIDYGALTLVTTDPFGMALRRSRPGDARTILIAPEVAELPPLPTRRDDADGERPQRFTTGVDDVAARPHASGDPMRRINWRATARRGELMVRLEESGAAPTARVVLDRGGWSPVANIVGLDESFERAVGAAAAVAVRFARDGYDVTISDASGAPLAGPLPAAEASDAHRVGVLLATVAADDGARRPLVDPDDGAEAGPVAVVSADGAGLSGIRTGAWTGILVRCTDVLDAAGGSAGAARGAGDVTGSEGELLPTPDTRGWLIADAPPGTELADAWRRAGS